MWIREVYYQALSYGLAHGVFSEPDTLEGVALVTWRNHWAILRTFTPNPLHWAERVYAEQQAGRRKEIQRIKDSAYALGYRAGVREASQLLPAEVS